MKTKYNIYCDESCHLERDEQTVMVLGALMCPSGKTKHVAEHIRSLKAKYNLAPGFEIKWTKVSNGQLPFYISLVDYFFSDPDLSFRAIVVPKRNLNHSAFGQDHDTFYYKMYFDMLKALLDPASEYFIYLDIKDTRSQTKVENLHDILGRNMYDFNRSIVKRIQSIHSHESAPMQLADLLIGSVSYANRDLSSSHAKLKVVQRIRRRTGYSLSRSTLLRERKFNLFCWTPTTVGP